ncbi:50S ribosomal protein L14e [Candidatus Woesearchaeota archaeon]|nr:50S ribosomal protein L14e [Candidatus Woesearchaeota archaeon]
MSLFAPGRVVLKIAGRDAGRKAVVVEELDNTFVLVDGDVRRKKVNVKHLEPTAETLKISSGASHEEVASAFKKLGLPVWETKAKTPAERPQQKRKEEPKVKKVK